MEYRRLTAAEYFEQIRDEDSFYIAKGNFLDDFYSANGEERVRMVSRPIPKERVTPDNRKYAAYFAAMVEYLCWHYNIERPDWVPDEINRLPDPWFLYELAVSGVAARHDAARVRFPQHLHGRRSGVSGVKVWTARTF